MESFYIWNQVYNIKVKSVDDLFIETGSARNILTIIIFLVLVINPLSYAKIAGWLIFMQLFYSKYWGIGKKSGRMFVQIKYFNMSIWRKTISFEDIKEFCFFERAPGRSTLTVFTLYLLTKSGNKYFIARNYKFEKIEGLVNEFNQYLPTHIVLHPINDSSFPK
jgi:hypothetical protein